MTDPTKQPELTLKLHNMVYRCKNCRQWKLVKEAAPQVVTQVVGIQDAPETVEKFIPAFTGAIFCPKCFKKLGFSDKAPQILVPHFVPPQDINNIITKKI